MRLVTKDLKCLESGGRTSDDLRRTTISHFCSLLLFAPSDPIETTRHVILPLHFLTFSQKANIVRRFYYFAPCNLLFFPHHFLSFAFHSCS